MAHFAVNHTPLASPADGYFFPAVVFLPCNSPVIMIID